MRLHTLAIFITYIRGVFLSCCTSKVVGDVQYRLTGEDPEMAQTLQCYDSCVYERLDQPGVQYCFKTGRFATFCTDSSLSSSVSPPKTTTTNSQSPENASSSTSKNYTISTITTTTTTPSTTTPSTITPTTTNPTNTTNSTTTNTTFTTTSITTTSTTTTTAPPERNGDCSLKCGTRNSLKRVVGGQNTQVNEYPWMVALKRPGHLPSCGASLLNSQWLVTAGHCIDSNIVLDIAVIGEHDLNTQTETVFTIERKVEKMIRHPAYNEWSLVNDIALFRLEEPVDTKVYNPVCLPARSQDYTGKTGWVLGWGKTSESGEQAAVLQELELQVVDDATCYNKMNGQTSAAEQLCAGGEEGKDGCQGDSGGPFVHQNGGHLELAGLTSWGYGCARPELYGVYTEISNYLDWIVETVASHENDPAITLETLRCV